MSKVSSVEYPTYSGSSVSIGGSKATTGLSNGVLTSNYQMSDNEQAIYDYAMKTLLESLPTVNTLSPETQQSLQSQLNAYTNKGIDSINQIYTPMISDLQNDVASRFGNLDNSIFTDNLNQIESNRSDAISSFAQDILAKQSELEDAQLNRQYSFIDLLTGVSDNIYSNALNAISTALGSSSNANSYNSNLYNALYKQYLSNNTSGSQLASSLGNALGLTSGSGASSILSFL